MMFYGILNIESEEKKMNKLWDIIAKGFEEDDKKRHRIKYDLGKTIDKTVKRIKKLKIEDLIKEK